MHTHQRNASVCTVFLPLTSATGLTALRISVCSTLADTSVGRQLMASVVVLSRTVLSPPCMQSVPIHRRHHIYGRSHAARLESTHAQGPCSVVVWCHGCHAMHSPRTLFCGVKDVGCVCVQPVSCPRPSSLTHLSTSPLTSHSVTCPMSQ